MYGLQLVTPPTVEPVSLSLAKRFAVIDDSFTDDDDLIQGFVTGARQLAEKYCRRAFFNQTWRLSLTRFPLFWGQSEVKNISDSTQWPFDFWFQGLTIMLPMAHAVSVTSITFIDNTNTLQALDPSAYNIDYDSEPCRLTPSNMAFWPTNLTTVYNPGNIKITFVAGSYGDGVTINNCPGTVSTAIALLTAHWYVNREGSQDIPAAFYSLLDSERFLTFSYNTY